MSDRDANERLQELARKGRDKGLCILPKNAGKWAAVDWLQFQDRLPTDEEIASWSWMYGAVVITGRVSGIVLVDADGEEGLETVKRLGHPPTPTVRTGSGGLHLHFRHPGGYLPNRTKFLPGLDFRGDGGLAVLPPSRHPDTGEAYEWLISFQEAEPTELPPWVLDNLDAGGKRKYKDLTESDEPIGEGERNETLHSYAGWLRWQGLSAEDILDLVRKQNERRCRPPLEDDEVHEIVGSAATYKRGTSRTFKNSPNGHGAQAEPAAKAASAVEEVGVTKLLADTILRDDHYAVDVGGKLYRYSEGSFRHGGNRHVKRRVKELLEEWGETKKWSSYRASEVIEYIKTDAPELWLKPPADEINVQNGILNLYTRELREHSPEFLSAIQIAVHFDPEARCEAWERYVVPSFPSDAPELPYEIAANIVAPYKANQKAVLLLGEGDNGKSTYLSALLRFLGGANATNMSLHRMENDRFSVARLVGKLANICPDLPSSHLNDTAVFKALTGDEGQLTAEYKHKDSFEFEPFTKLVFSANHPPRSSDGSHAFFRRWVVAPFVRSFSEDEKLAREDLDAMLTAKVEFSGVLNKILEVVGRVRTKGFTESKSMKEAWEEFRHTTDPVSVWLDRNTIMGPEIYVTKDALLQAFNTDDKNSGRIMTPTAFTQAMKRLRPELEIKQRTVNGKVTRVWVGIGLKTDGDGGGDGGGGGGGNPSPSSQPSHLSQLSSNYSEKSPEGEKRGEEATSHNKGKPVKPVKPVSGEGGGEQTDLEKQDEQAAAIGPEQEEQAVIDQLVKEGMSEKEAYKAVMHPKY
jgi:putative DNA primase/helicase